MSLQSLGHVALVVHINIDKTLQVDRHRLAVLLEYDSGSQLRSLVDVIVVQGRDIQ